MHIIVSILTEEHPMTATNDNDNVVKAFKTKFDRGSKAEEHPMTFSNDNDNVVNVKHDQIWQSIQD